jgi:hypothetical protein
MPNPWLFAPDCLLPLSVIAWLRRPSQSTPARSLSLLHIHTHTLHTTERDELLPAAQLAAWARDATSADVRLYEGVSHAGCLVRGPVLEPLVAAAHHMAAAYDLEHQPDCSEK